MTVSLDLTDRAVAFVILVAILALSVVLLAHVRSSLRGTAPSWSTAELELELIVYDVPQDQDPVDVIQALSRAGYVAVRDTVHGAPRVLVFSSGDPETRLVIRAVIGAVASPASNGVRFTDEA